MSSDWEILFSRAIRQLEEGGITKKDWVFGGGTVLSQMFEHRVSKDIDIFFRTPQLLAHVSPTRNDGVAAHLCDYAETGVFIRLHFTEGEVDFIAAPQISDAKPSYRKILEHYAWVDNPIEIIAKKIHFRAEEFKPRDMFDLATVYQARKPAVLKHAKAFAEKLAVLDARLTAIEASGVLNTHLSALAILPGGEKIRGQEMTLCRAFVQDVSRQLQLEKERGPGHGRGIAAR